MLCEYTSRPFNRTLEQTIKLKAYSIFTVQNDRRFVIILTIADRNLRLHLFDRAGALYSRPYNIHQHPRVLIHIMCLALTAPEDFLGYDPTILIRTLIPSSGQPARPLKSAKAAARTIMFPAQ